MPLRVHSYRGTCSDATVKFPSWISQNFNQNFQVCLSFVSDVICKKNYPQTTVDAIWDILDRDKLPTNNNKEIDLEKIAIDFLKDSQSNIESTPRMITKPSSLKYQSYKDIHLKTKHREWIRNLMYSSCSCPLCQSKMKLEILQHRTTVVSIRKGLNEGS
jgi:hypothetical protein